MKKDNWIYKVFFMTFVLSILFSGVSNAITTYTTNKIILIISILIIIFLGVIFDIIGLSILTSKESTFHAKSAQKIKGAKESINLIKNSTRIVTVCNDIIGDIAGIVSGSLGALLSILIANDYNINIALVAIFVTAIISSLTVGTKAIGKKITEKKCDDVTFAAGKLLSLLQFK